MSNMPKPNTTPWGKFRDNLAHAIMSAALVYIATPWYRGMIEGSILLGLEAAKKEWGKEEQK